MIYTTVDEIPEDRYLEMLLAGDEDEDLEEFETEEDEEVLGDGGDRIGE